MRGENLSTLLVILLFLSVPLTLWVRGKLNAAPPTVAWRYRFNMDGALGQWVYSDGPTMPKVAVGYGVWVEFEPLIVRPSVLPSAKRSDR